MMPRGQQLLLPVNVWFIWGSLFVALMLNMMPVGVVIWMPDWLAVVLFFWCLHQPEKIGVGIAFFFGLLVDVHHASMLGEHALAYSFLGFTAQLIQRRLIWFTLASQAIQILPFFAFAHGVILVVHLLGGDAFPGYAMLIAALLEAALWPVVTLLLLAPQHRAPERDAHRPL